MVQQLLSRRWVDLKTGLASLDGGQYPGVYILAYSPKNLGGKAIKLADIFYVGRSNALGGVKSRLREFLRGIENGKSHSAAIRFFKVYARGVPFSKLKRRNKFLVASISLPCAVAKTQRTPDDLRKMGLVAKLEYDVLAHIKDVRGREPKLNKQ